MNTNNPTAADAPVPPEGTEQAAQQPQPPPAESGVLDTVSSVVEGVCDVADVVGSVLSIFDV